MIYYKKRGILWNKNPFATDPYGAVTIDNGKPIFVNHKRNPEYQRMFLI